MKKLIIAAMLLSTSAFAQDKEITLKVAPADVQILGEALQMMPYGKVAPLMQKLQIQINAQNLPVSAANPIPASKVEAPKE